MGYAECHTMESRTGSVSSGLGSSSGLRGQTVKSSPFCPRSTSKLTQSIIKDHMMSHYKKVYSAKAAIDASVPKSLIHSVKYNDQLRQERLRKGVRPHSAQSLSQRNGRASCSSVQSRLSLDYDDRPYLCSRSSTLSSPRFNTSFHANEMVYSSHKMGAQNRPIHHTRPASELRYRSPEGTSRRLQSTYSLEASGDQGGYKTFQDPVQKTYSGDLLEKHSQRFTPHKPFTPKTLKSASSSHLSQYRYYRAPRRKPTPDGTSSRLMRQETYHGSTKTKEDTQEFYETSQGFNTEHEWSEDEYSSTYRSASRQQSGANKSSHRDLFDTSSRVSTEGEKLPTMNSVSTEEEELMYLELISAVTEDILSRGHISDRVVDRVIKHHIEMNRHQLDEGKMRHLLEVMRKDFEEPTNVPSSSAELYKKKNGVLDGFPPHLESAGDQVKTKENDDLFSYASLIEYREALGYTGPSLVSTPSHSPQRAASPTETNEKDGEDEKRIISPGLSEHVSDNTWLREEDLHEEQVGTTTTNNEGIGDSHENTTETSEEAQVEVTDDGHSKEMDDLGKSFSESLHVSSNTHHNNVETSEQHVLNDTPVSDDEF